MPKLKAGVADATKYFNLDGLDYQVSIWEIFYDSVELLPDGTIDETKIRVGLRAEYDVLTVIKSPALVADWTDSTDTAYVSLDALLIDLATLIGIESTQGEDTNILALASAVRTASVNGEDLKNVSSKGAHVIIDVTKVTSEGSVSLDSGESDKATATAQLQSAIAVAIADGTVTCATVLENTFSTATAQMQTVLENTFSTATAQAQSSVASEFASGTVTCSTAIVGNSVTVNGLTYVGVAGAKADNTEFSIDGGDSATATDLALSITDDARVGTLNDVNAAAIGAVVTITQTVTGAGGNATTLVSSGATLAVSGAVFSGGVNADTVTVNGLVYTAVAGAKGDNYTYSIDTGDDETATDLADSITNDDRVGTLGTCSATASTDTVTITTDVEGVAGDATTLTSTAAGRMVLSGGTFSGGVDADTVTVNGLVYTAVAGAKADNTEFSTDTSDDATATDLADSITNDVRVGTLGGCTASAITDTVTITTDVAGVAGDAITLTSTGGARVVLSGAVFSGGVDADTVTINGLVYTAVAGAKADNTQFSTDTGDDETATDLADSINNDVRVGTLGTCSATSLTDTVTIVTDQRGVAGNAVTLVSSDGITLAVSAGTLTGGLEADTVTVNGLVYTAVAGSKGGDNTLFSIDVGDTNAATDLAASITADVRVGTLNDVTAASGGTDTVTMTTSIGGTVGNPTTLTSTGGARVVLSGATFSGGADNANVSSITVDGVELMSGTEIFDTTLAQTAINVAANITAHTSVPNYVAEAVGTTIKIDSLSGGDTFVVVSTAAVIGTTDADLGSASVVFTLQGKDEISGSYYTLIQSAAVDAVGTTVLRVYPALTASPNLIVSDVLPEDFRVIATHADDSSITYSVAVNLLN